MSLVFVFSLVIAAISAYILKNSSEEMAYLSGSVLLASLLISLVFAPWQLQILLLILVLVSNRRQLLSAQPPAQPEEEKKIQLTYRGAKYEPTPPLVETSKGEIQGKYRGLIWRVRPQ